MPKINIDCTKYESEMIKDALSCVCPFKSGTIENCGEDSDCHDCINENIDFNINTDIGVSESNRGKNERTGN